MAELLNNEADTLALSEPLTIGSEIVSVLTFKRPTVAEVRKIGYPIYFSDEGDLKINADVAAKYICALASIPPSAVDRMSISDFTAAVGKIGSFFGTGG